MKRNPILCFLWIATALVSQAAEKDDGNIKPIGVAEHYWLLHQACLHGDSIGVKILLKAGADVNGKSDYEAAYTSGLIHFEPSWPLVTASRKGHKDVVKILIESGAKLDQWGAEGITPLYAAAANKHVDVVEMLLRAGADRNYRLELGFSIREVLRFSKGKEVKAIAKMLLDAGVDDIFPHKNSNFEPSHAINKASWGGHSGVVELLLSRGEKADQPEGDGYGYTALIVATVNNHPEVVELLLKAGANKNYQCNGWTASQIAKEQGFEAIAKLLSEPSSKIEQDAGGKRDK